MKFPTAKEIRESVKQNNKKTIKLARKNFNKYKKNFLRAITVTSSQGLFEFHCQLFYPSEFSYRYKSIRKNISALPLAFSLLVGIKFSSFLLLRLNLLLGHE